MLVQIKLGQCQGRGVSDSTFKIIPGKRLATGVTHIQTVERGGLTLRDCATACRVECGMFEYSQVHSVCKFYSERNYDFGYTVSSDADWTWAYKRRHTTVVFQTGWTLVFRAQAKIAVGAFETWNDTDATTDNPVRDDFPHACLRLVEYESCDRHFRSHVIDNWVNIDQVRFSLISGGLEVAYILFDGVGSNSTSWFSQDRVVKSSWPDLGSDSAVETFDLFGMRVVPKLWRTFLIFGPAAVCNMDQMYTMVIDQGSDSCCLALFWNIVYDGFPSFYYSKMPGLGALHTLM
ncbi:hypothetical protein EGW08_017320, partial [Elysia chlorotica]